jgi:intracellular multiplication protein IcmG
MAEKRSDENELGSEYQFNDEPNGATYDYEDVSDGVSTKSRFAFLGNKKARWLIILIVLLIVFFVVYELATSSTSELKHRVPVKPSPTIATPTKITHSTISAQEALAEEQAQREKVQLAKKNQQIDQMKAFQETTQQQVGELQRQQFSSKTQLVNLQDKLDGLGAAVADVHHSVGQVAQTLTSMQQRTRMIKREKQQAARRHAVLLRREKSYFVSAVLPGRAWLKGADGTTVTVIVGNTLPGYGKVLSIDPYSGVVRTTHAVLRYSVA